MPEMKRVALTIRQQCRVSARGVFVHDKESETDKTPIPGFGKLAEDTNAVSIVKSEPTWQPESPGNPKGRFSEDIIISSWVTFQSPPPFETEFLSEWVSYLSKFPAGPAALFNKIYPCRSFWTSLSTSPGWVIT